MKYGCPQHARPGAVARAAVNNSFGQWCSTHLPLQFSDVLVHALAVLWLNSSRGAVLKRLISSMPRRVQACVEVKGAMTPY